MSSIKQKIDSTIPKVIEKVGRRLNPLILNLKNENDRLLIFYFHGVYKDEREKELHHVDPQNNVTVEQFEGFVEYFLSHGYRFIKPDDLLNGLEKGHPYIMITFDDGYYNNHLVLKSLEKYKVPATFFVSARNVLENKSFWWDIIYKHRMKEGVPLQEIRREQDSLKELKYTQIDEYINEHFGIESNTPWSDIDRSFTPEELREFAKSPYVFIDNHTFNHAILTNYNEEEVREQLESTNEGLTKIIDKTPTGIAFPNGNYNESVLKVAEEVGFRFAYTVQPKTHNLPIPEVGKKMICLHRYMPKPQDIREYGSFCRMGYSPNPLYEKLKGKVLSYGKSKV